MIKNLIGLFFAFLFAVFFISHPPAFSKPTSGCVDNGVLIKYVTERFPDQRTVHLVGDNATEFMVYYNAVPPVSELVATEVLIVFHSTFKVARIAFFRRGCVIVMATVPIPAMELLLRKTIGQSV